MSWAAFIPMALQAASNIFGKKSSTWSGTKPSLKKFETLTHGQKNLLNDILKHPNLHFPDINKNQTYQAGNTYLQNILSQNPEMMKQFEAPYMRQFSEEIMPNIAEQFAGAGAMSGSGFQNAAASAGSSLMERLAALRGNLGMQAANQALGYSQLPFQQALQGNALNLQRMQLGLGTPAFGYQEIPGQPGLKQGFQGAMGEASGNAFSRLFGGSSSPNSMNLYSSNNLG